MILADKIIRLRKRNGWSQEELAAKMNVSRQAVSKWEAAQTTPDLEKILQLGNLFGVTTDYLLKDEMEDEEFTDETDIPVKRITLSQADHFLKWRKSASVKIAVATFLCVIAVIPLLLLGAVSEVALSISENVAGGIGLVSLFVFVAVAVAIFLHCGFKNAPYDFIDKEPFETEYGVTGMVKERQKEYRPVYVRSNMIATGICILSPVPLLVGAFAENEFLIVIMLAITLLLAGIGAGIFIISIAMALISEPQILFLDEPTLGLDVLARSDLWDTIRTLKGKTTIILTTHYMEEAEALADRIGIMKDGKLLALGTAEALKAKAGTEKFEDAFVAIVKGSKKL